MPGGTAGSLLVVALCLAAAAFCFSHTPWGGPWSFVAVLWAIAGFLFLGVGLVIAALLIAARI